METNKQTQSAGDNSTQMQAVVINNTYVQGITPEQAHEIMRNIFEGERKRWTEEASRIVEERVGNLENKIMPKFMAYDQTLEFFSDPAFQIALGKAQVSAAASNRESDYELLSDLLLHRVEHRNDLKIVPGINRAIEIAWEVPEDALAGLSIVYVVSRLIPDTFDMQMGLSVLNDICGKIMNGHELPEGEGWIEEMGVLYAIRIVDVQSFKKIKIFLSEHLAKYLDSGVKEGSEELTRTVREFGQCELPSNTLIPHPLRQGFIKLNVDRDLDKMRIIYKFSSGAKLETKYNSKQIEVLKRAIPIFQKDESKNPVVQDAFMKEWNKYPNLKIVGEWWDRLPLYFAITPIGVALANAYSHGKAPNIPSLY